MGFKPNYKKMLPHGFSLLAEAYRIFAFFDFGLSRAADINPTT